MKFGVRVQICDSLPRAKFCKNCLRGLAPYGQILTNQKIRILTILVDFGSHLYSYDGEMWHEGADLGDWDSPTPNFVKKIIQGDSSLMGNFYQKNRNFRDYELLKLTYAGCLKK